MRHNWPSGLKCFVAFCHALHVLNIRGSHFFKKTGFQNCKLLKNCSKTLMSQKLSYIKLLNLSFKHRQEWRSFNKRMSCGIATRKTCEKCNSCRRQGKHPAAYLGLYENEAAKIIIKL